MTDSNSFAPASGLPFLEAAEYLSLLQLWLEANLAQFNYVFATVNLTPSFPTQPNADFSWLTPSWYSYAVAEPALNPTVDNCVFAILCLIDGTQPFTTGSASLQQCYSCRREGRVPDSAQHFSETHYARCGSADVLRAIGRGCPCELYDRQQWHENHSTTDQTLLPLSMDQGITVTPSVSAGNFTVSIIGAELMLNISDMKFNWSPGIDVHLGYTGYVSVGFEATLGHLVFKLDQQTAPAPIAVNQAWLNDVNISIGVIGAIASLLGGIGGAVQIMKTPVAAVAQAGAANAGAAAAAAANVAQNVNQAATLSARAVAFLKVAAFMALGGAAAAMPVTITAILDAIATGNYSAVPKLADLANVAVGEVVTWPSSVGSYKLQSAQLNNALILGLG